MTKREKDIIENAVNTALEFGLGLLSNCKEELEDHGYEMTAEHVNYMLEYSKKETRR